MRRLTAQSAVLAIAVALLLLLPAVALVRSQADARDDLIERFEERAGTARNISTLILDSYDNAAEAGKASFSEERPSRSSLIGYMRAVGRAPTESYVALLDESGRILLSLPPSLSRDPSLMEQVAVRKALAGEPFMGPVTGSPIGPVTIQGTPFETPHGVRITAEGLPVSEFGAVFNQYLKTLVAIDGERAFLMDSNGRMLGSSEGGKPGGKIADRTLLDELAGAPSGSFGEDRTRYTTVPIAGTDFRFVVTVTEADLFAPLADSALISWLLYAAYALVLLTGLALLVSSLNRRRAAAVESERAAGRTRVLRERLSDRVTGLPNKASFTDSVERALANRPGGEPVAVLLMDIQRFKRINEAFGHRAGDEILRQIAARIGARLLEGDVLARIGSDHFGILRRTLRGEEEAETLAETVQRAALVPFRTAGTDVRISVTIGIAVASASASADSIMSDADTALDHARSRGEPFAVLGEGAAARVQDRLVLESELRDAMVSDQLVLHYQPVIELETGRATGFEALVRWKHPSRGLLRPIEFVPLAEETGLILELGEWVLGAACRQAAAWRWAGHSVHMDVNLSAIQLREQGIATTVSAALAGSGLEPHALVLEVTETALAEDERVISALTELRELGAKIAIDDFGVGYSSWARLAQLPVDMLKIDRSFVTAMGADRNAAVLASMIRLGSDLGAVVVAEGAERLDEVEKLLEMRCPQVQGFYFSRPVPAPEAESRLESVFAFGEAPARPGRTPGSPRR